MLWSAIAYTYQGSYEDALATYGSRHGRFASSGMPRLQVWRILVTWGTMLAHLGALATSPAAPRHRKAALERIKQLEREGLEWPRPFAWAGRATLAHLSGRDAERDRALGAAIAHAQGMGYTPFALLFEHAGAAVRHDERGQRRHEEALSALGFASVAGFARAFSPGLSPREGP
jgi:hypothetical protein